MSNATKWLVGVLITITAVSVIAVVFMAVRRAHADPENEHETVRTPSPSSVQNGHAVVTVNSETQAREGIQVVPIKVTSMRTELHGIAVLLPVSDLANLRNAYVTATTRLQRARADLTLSKNEYERVKTLYEQDQNMSLRAMQSAEATYRTNEAQLQADQQDAALQLDMTRQRWGPAVARWIERQSPVLERVLEQRDFLAQVIFPPGEVAKAPAGLSLQVPGGHFVQASYVSQFPQVNPQIQAISFLYLVPVHSGLAVGMNLAVQIPVGKLLKGTVIPEAAVVWSQGKAWAYEATSPTAFMRREVPTDNPVASGYFVPGAALVPGTKVVVAGAQTLLSQESRSQAQQED
jgi:hypothetical protein